MAHVGLWYEHTLLTRQAALDADIIKALDLLVHASDGLDLTTLIDGTRHGEILTQRQVGQAGQEGVQFSDGRTVALNAAVGLLKTQAG